MYVVKFKPTGQYLRKVKNPRYYAFSYFDFVNGNNKWFDPKKFLTDDLSKARVYGNIGHVKNSLGTQHILGVDKKKIPFARWNGKAFDTVYEEREVPRYSSTEIDPEIWEVIELEVKEK